MRCVRRAGMAGLCRETGGSPAITIALIDGKADLGIASLRSATIQLIDQWQQGISATPSAAAAHATFIASMFVGARPQCLGLCPTCRLLVLPAVDDQMLRPGSDPMVASRRISEAIYTAARFGAKIIQLSVELGFRCKQASERVATALRFCLARGMAVVLAAGHGQLSEHNEFLSAPGTTPVAAADELGNLLFDERWGTSIAVRGLVACGWRIVISQ